MRFADSAALEAWLTENHATAADLWIEIAKKSSGIESVTASEAIDCMLCFGWIDGQRVGLDDRYFRQRYCPRRARSTWSAVNVDRVARLDAENRMRPSGWAEVERAKADGRWDAAYAAQASYELPADVDEAWLDGLGRTERYLAVLPVLKARTEAARAKAINALRGRTSDRPL